MGRSSANTDLNETTGRPGATRPCGRSGRICQKHQHSNRPRPLRAHKTCARLAPTTSSHRRPNGTPAGPLRDATRRRRCPNLASRRRPAQGPARHRDDARGERAFGAIAANDGTIRYVPSLMPPGGFANASFRSVRHRREPPLARLPRPQRCSRPDGHGPRMPKRSHVRSLERRECRIVDDANREALRRELDAWLRVRE